MAAAGGKALAFQPDRLALRCAFGGDQHAAAMRGVELETRAGADLTGGSGDLEPEVVAADADARRGSEEDLDQEVASVLATKAQDFARPQPLRQPQVRLASAGEGQAPAPPLDRLLEGDRQDQRARVGRGLACWREDHRALRRRLQQPVGFDHLAQPLGIAPAQVRMSRLDRCAIGAAQRGRVRILGKAQELARLASRHRRP